jgi:hypothetical protein
MIFIEFNDCVVGKKVSVRADRIIGFQHVSQHVRAEVSEGELPIEKCCEVFTDDKSEWTVGHTYEEVKETLNKLEA